MTSSFPVSYDGLTGEGRPPGYASWHGLRRIKAVLGPGVREP